MSHDTPSQRIFMFIVSLFILVKCLVGGLVFNILTLK